MNVSKHALRVLAMLAVTLFGSGAFAQNASWTFASVHRSPGDKALPSLTLGSPTHQASIFEAACFGRSDRMIDVVVLRDHEGFKRTGPAVVSFSGTVGTPAYPGEGVQLQGEKDMIRILVSADDPLWQLVTGTSGFSFSTSGGGGFSANLPGAGQLATDFLAACSTESGASSSTAQPRTSGVQPGLAVIQTFRCEDGSDLEAQYHNTDAYTIALVTHPSMASDIVSRNVPLIETVSGSGSAYSNGDYTLQTKGDSAILSRGNNVTRCTAE